MAWLLITRIPATTPPVPMAIGKVMFSSSSTIAKTAAKTGAVAASPLVRVGPKSLTPATAKFKDNAGRNNPTKANRK